MTNIHIKKIFRAYSVYNLKYLIWIESGNQNRNYEDVI